MICYYINMTIGEKIYKLRKDLALSQEEFAFRIGVSKQAVFNWENGFACPKLTRLEKISEEFNVNIDYFIKEESEQTIKEEENFESKGSVKSLKLKHLTVVLSLCALLIAIIALSIIFGFSVFSSNKGLTRVVIIDSDIFMWVGFVLMIAIALCLLLLIISLIKRNYKKENEKQNKN